MNQTSQNRPSDASILDLIEDFLVNHFGEDERQDIERGQAFEMLEHVSDLVNLRNTSTAPHIEPTA